MKRAILFLIAAMIYSLTYATSVTVSGTVSGTWSSDTVFVEGDIQVLSGEHLIISPGTFIQFQAYFRFDVSGSLSAQGSISDSIVFTAKDTSNFYVQAQGRGGWSGFRFRQVSLEEDSSVFSFCRFEYGKATEDSSNCYGGAFYVDSFDKIAFRNCLFFHNYSYYSGGAVYLKESNAEILQCAFKSNYAGNNEGIIYGYGGGICGMYSSPVIRGCKFYNNSSTGVGGGASFDHCDPVFEQNIMTGNYSALGGALGILRSSPEHTISNLLVSDNEATFFGGGICCIRSFPVFSNITITENNSSYGGAFYCNDSASPSMYNSILWGNSGFGLSVYIWDVYSAPNFYYCDIEGDTSSFEGSGAHEGYHGEYMNNQNADPEFINTGDYPTMLLDGSPCIDNGTPDAEFLLLPPLDLRGIPRIYNNRLDLGAYEYDGTTATKDAIYNAKDFVLYPNPCNSSVTITIPEGVCIEGYLKIYDVNGRLVANIFKQSGQQGVLWDCRNSDGMIIPVGIYIISLTNGNDKYTGRLIKLNSTL